MSETIDDGYEVDDVGEFKCKSCDKKFSHKGMMRRHVRAHRRTVTEFRCLKCGDTFFYNSSLSRHIATVHSVEMPFKCTIAECDRRFKYKSALDYHLLVHEGKLDHPCDICGKGFLTQDKLLRHIKCHVFSKGKIRCVRGCGKEFVGYDKWLIHHQDHADCTGANAQFQFNDTPTPITLDALLPQQQNQLLDNPNLIQRTRIVGPNLITTASI